MGGSSRKKARATDTSAAQAQAEQTRMARELFSQSAPSRQMLFDRGEEFLSGNFDVTSSPTFAAGKAGIEDQVSRAQDSLIGNMPAGGGLSSALAGVEGQRLRGFGDLSAMIAGDEANRITGLATGGGVQGSNVMGGASAIAAQRAQAAAQESAGKSQGAGSAVGSIGGALMPTK